MYKVGKNLISIIGKTPVVRLLNIERCFNLGARLYAKLEMFNPSGSVKDRAAYFMVDRAFLEGKIREKTIIIEPTSGNMGISLAMLSSLYGYKAKIVMPDNMSSERISLIKSYGAEITLTPGEEGMKGALDMTEKMLKQEKNALTLSQFENKQNSLSHYLTTAPEIHSTLSGNIDCFVCGVGTAGTIGGVGQYFKEKTKRVKIIAVEPSVSQVLSGKEAGTHRIQGIGAGFIPPLLDFQYIDKVIAVSDEESEMMVKILVMREGIFAGISSGAVLSASIKVASMSENRNKNIVMLFADGGEKYLSKVR